MSGANQVLFSFPNPRGLVIGGSILVPDCVVEEIGRDELTITDHPVEFGAEISDHAFNKPRQVTLHWSWSNSSLHFTETFCIDMYNTLLQVQAARQPFVLYTGKSVYQNMLIQSVSQTTNAGSEYSLVTVISCREVIIAYTATTASSQSAPQSAQADPKNTAPVKSEGTKQLAPKGTIADVISGKTQFPQPASIT